MVSSNPKCDITLFLSPKQEPWCPNNIPEPRRQVLRSFFDNFQKNAKEKYFLEEVVNHKFFSDNSSNYLGKITRNEKKIPQEKNDI